MFRETRSTILIDKQKDCDKTSWLVFFAAAAYFFFSIMQLSLFNVLSPFLMIHLHINSLGLGILSSSYLYILAVTLLPAGYLLDYASTRKIVLITLTFSVIGTLLIAVSLNFFSMIIYRLITGIANGFAFLAALHVVYYWFPKKNASVSGLMIAFGMSGGGFASILFSHLFVHIGLKSGLGINVGIGTAILLIAFLFLHDHKDTNKQITSFPSFAKNIRFVAYIPQNWFCGIYTGMLNLSIYILAALWGNLYLIERYSLKNTVAASIVAMIFLGIIIGSPLWGWFSDRIHSRKKPMLFGGILSLIMILRILFADDPSTISLIILFFSLGIATSSQVISYSTIAESNNKKLISTATSFAALIINFIGAVGQFLFGWLLSVFWNGQMKNNLPIYSGNNLKLALLSLIVAFWLACIMVFFIQEPK